MFKIAIQLSLLILGATLLTLPAFAQRAERPDRPDRFAEPPERPGRPDQPGRPTDDGPKPNLLTPDSYSEPLGIVAFGEDGVRSIDLKGVYDFGSILAPYVLSRGVRTLAIPRLSLVSPAVEIGQDHLGIGANLGAPWFGNAGASFIFSKQGFGIRGQSQIFGINYETPTLYAKPQQLSDYYFERIGPGSDLYLESYIEQTSIP